MVGSGGYTTPEMMACMSCSHDLGTVYTSSSIAQSVASKVLPDEVMSEVVRSSRTTARATRRIGEPVNNAIVFPALANTKYRVDPADATAARPAAITMLLANPNSKNQPSPNAAITVTKTNGSQSLFRCHM